MNIVEKKVLLNLKYKDIKNVILLDSEREVQRHKKYETKINIITHGLSKKKVINTGI